MSERASECDGGGDPGVNVCRVKYIHLGLDKSPNEYHVAKDYELCEKIIRHNDFEDMHERVLEQCPAGFECREPLALFHEVMWSCGIVVDEGSGELKRAALERDELHHAIEKDEYNILWAPGERVKVDEALSICVDIVQKQTPPPCVPADGVMMML
jgi:hypothetical protein